MAKKTYRFKIRTKVGFVTGERVAWSKLALRDELHEAHSRNVVHVRKTKDILIWDPAKEKEPHFA